MIIIGISAISNYYLLLFVICYHLLLVAITVISSCYYWCYFHHYCHIVSMPSPCHCHAIAMSLASLGKVKSRLHGHPIINHSRKVNEEL